MKDYILQGAETSPSETIWAFDLGKDSLTPSSLQTVLAIKKQAANAPYGSHRFTLQQAVWLYPSQSGRPTVFDPKHLRKIKMGRAKRPVKELRFNVWPALPACAVLPTVWNTKHRRF